MSSQADRPLASLHRAIERLSINDPDHHDIFAPGARLKEVKPMPFSITHSHGVTETAIETYEEAIERVRTVYGADCEIGHDGDIAEGGEKTLVWRDEESAQDDDGSRAVCSIRVSHEVAS